MAASDARARLVASMCKALQRRGLHGVGLNEILAEAGAPKGVLYHHFPGGKTELAVAAIGESAEAIGRSLDKAVQRGADPQAALLEWLSRAARHLSESRFELGCPLATVALESGPDDVQIRAALASAFDGLRRRVASTLSASGYGDATACGLAALVVAAYEGSLLQARVANSAEPMTAVVASLASLLGQPRGRMPAR